MLKPMHLQAMFGNSGIWIFFSFSGAFSWLASFGKFGEVSGPDHNHPVLQGGGFGGFEVVKSMKGPLLGAGETTEPFVFLFFWRNRPYLILLVSWDGGDIYKNLSIFSRPTISRWTRGKCVLFKVFFSEHVAIFLSKNCPGE